MIIVFCVHYINLQNYYHVHFLCLVFQYEAQGEPVTPIMLLTDVYT